MNSQRNSAFFHGLRGAASDSSRKVKLPGAPSAFNNRYAFSEQVAAPLPTYTETYPETENLQFDSEAVHNSSIDFTTFATSPNTSSLNSHDWFQDSLTNNNDSFPDLFCPLTPTLATTSFPPQDFSQLDQLERFMQSEPEQADLLPQYDLFGYGRQKTFTLGEMMPNATLESDAESSDDISSFGSVSTCFDDVYDERVIGRRILSVLASMPSTSCGHDLSISWPSDCSSALLANCPVSPMWSSASPSSSTLSFTDSPQIPSGSCSSPFWGPTVKTEPAASNFSSGGRTRHILNNANLPQTMEPHRRGRGAAKRKTEEDIAEPEVVVKKAKKAKKAPTTHACNFEGCDKVFDRKSNLGSHLATHYNVRQHHCPECDSSFLRIYDLDRHIRSHTKEIKYPCTHKGCIKGYGRSDQLKRHLEKNH
ncbi:hypothetical protein CPC16_011187 [Podila verticillata]|nr:hypothetical protein BGZ59_000907 [Podila verticillata]KAF9394479.1 hypothetical protein CPC16_011187 [Podila verticillata]KFH72418.1 hypothetical protein MVEG_02709 [Podila verticillata NRRL 6337]